MAWVVYASDSKTSGAYADLATARRRAQAEANRTGGTAIVYPTSRTGRTKGKTHHVKPSKSNPKGKPYQSAVGHYYFDKRRRSHGPYKTKKARLAAQRKRKTNPEDPYYWRKEGGLWVLRQKRFKHLLDGGKREHPHDIMAYARTPEEKKSMYRTITGRDQEENPRPYTLHTVAPLLKRNPGRLTDVLVRKGGKVFKAKAKYDAKVGRVRVFANPSGPPEFTANFSKKSDAEKVARQYKAKGYSTHIVRIGKTYELRVYSMWTPESARRRVGGTWGT